ncbi:MAG: hypothetical protein ACR2MB_09960 [Acidimicrobiales bacterium]
MTAKVGAKHAKPAERSASRHGREDGSVVFGGRRVPVRRPRARTTAGEEVALESYSTFAADDLLSNDSPNPAKHGRIPTAGSSQS